MSQLRYVITKKTRMGDTPYRGKSCVKAGILPGATYTDLGVARLDAQRLQKVNPCGWIIKPIVF